MNSTAHTESIQQDSWMSKVMGKPVYRVNADVGLAEHVMTQSQAFYYGKFDVKSAAAVAQLTQTGMMVVDVNVVFELEKASTLLQGEPAILVREALPSDVDRVFQIAETAFRYSRFHLDPLVPDQVANSIKREWVVSYAQGQRGDRLFVAVDGDVPVGFLAALWSEGEGVATIDLIAADSAHQQRGVGVSLVNAFRAFYSQANRYRVGTQVANVPSVRFYEKLGFRLASSQYVLHAHVQNGAAVFPPS